MTTSNIIIPKIQKAAVIVEKGKIEYKEVPVGKPSSKQVLVKVHKTGVCHSDLHIMEGDWAQLPFKSNTIGGHEGAGLVVEVGEDVTHIKVGDRVGIAWLAEACGLCDHCLQGHEAFCDNAKSSGYSVAGTFQEFAVANASHVAKIPNAVSFEQAAPILCAGVTVYKGLKETGLKPGETVLIVGAGGGLGHLAVQYAKAMGLHVIGIDSGAAKERMLVEDLKIDHFIDFAKDDPVKRVRQLTNKKGVDGVLIVSASGKAFEAAINYVRKRGIIVCIGLPPDKFTVPILSVVMMGITIKGSIIGTRYDLAEALQFAAKGKVRCCVEVEPFEKLKEVFDRMKKGSIAGRVVLDVVPHSKL